MSKDASDIKEPIDESTLPAYSVLPPDAFNPIEGMIPPRRYQIQHDGFMKGARFWIVDPSTGPSSQALGAPELDYDSKGDWEPDEKAEGLNVRIESSPSTAQASEQGSSKEKEKEKKNKFRTIDPAVVPGHYYVKRIKSGACALFEGPGPDDQFAGSRRLIDINGEGFFNKKSSYTEVSGQCRHARMYGIPPWYSCDRELEDFEGKLWVFHTKGPTWIDDIEVSMDVEFGQPLLDTLMHHNWQIKRKTDGVEVAFFDFAAWSFRGIGILDIKEPLTPDIFYLILCAWYVKYDVDALRRTGARSGAGS
ncbi:hypothetical protein FRC04_005885 [Tulasnella sp. 424]|nr:hypothetical protein FRC04_005885 [Tulasnella sp. 424]KAG8976030.1 hypothetical protein FRC05_004661 [Tulasnella sp. 425]